MKWAWRDVQALPSDVYDDLVRWLTEDDSGEDVIDMDA